MTKDSHLLIESVKKKVKLNIIKSARKINEDLPLKTINIVKKKVQWPVKKILFCGLAFKGVPETSDTRGSMANSIINTCRKKFKKSEIFALDNFVSIEDALAIYGSIKFKKEFVKINHKFDLIFILNNNPYWKKIGLKNLKKKLNKEGMIFDFWSSFKNTTHEKKYFKFGEGKLLNKKEI